jgi:hypothetical protein
MAKKYDHLPPLSDFVRADPGKGLLADVREARNVGPSKIGDHKCHHLAFREKSLDWQLWVEDRAGGMWYQPHFSGGRPIFLAVPPLF